MKWFIWINGKYSLKVLELFPSSVEVSPPALDFTHLDHKSKCGIGFAPQNIEHLSIIYNGRLCSKIPHKKKIFESQFNLPKQFCQRYFVGKRKYQLKQTDKPNYPKQKITIQNKNRCEDDHGEHLCKWKQILILCIHTRRKLLSHFLRTAFIEKRALYLAIASVCDSIAIC